MVKRFVCFGCAVVLALSCSLVSFASDTTSTIQMDFPFFRYARLRQAGGVIYQGADGERPITGVFADTTASPGTSNGIIIDLFMGKTYDLGVVSGGNQTISYDVPIISAIGTGNPSGIGITTIQASITTSTSGTHKESSYDVDPSHNLDVNGNPTKYYVDSHNTNVSESTSGSFVLDNGFLKPGYTSRSYTATIRGGEALKLVNNTVVGGDYIVSGYFDFPEGTFENNDISIISESLFDVTIFNSGATAPTIVNVTDYEYSFVRSATDQRVLWSVAFNVPVTSNVSNIQLFWRRAPSNGILRWGVSTGGVEYKDTVTGIAGLSAELANWFGGLKSGISSGFSKIAGLIIKQDSEAEEAVSDSTANSEAAVVSEKVSNIETFENDMINGAATQLENVDFTVPTSFGAASAFVGYIVTGVFNRLGGYQAVISVPLTFGLLLLLLGRGDRALGMFVNMRGRGGSSSDSGGEE